MTSQSNLFGTDVRVKTIPSKVELKSRLYDKGLSEKTMPSVTRPNLPSEGTTSIKAKLKGEKIADKQVSKGHLPPPVSDLSKVIPKALPPSGLIGINSKLLPPHLMRGGEKKQHHHMV